MVLQETLGIPSPWQHDGSAESCINYKGLHSWMKGEGAALSCKDMWLFGREG